MFSNLQWIKFFKKSWLAWFPVRLTKRLLWALKHPEINILRSFHMQF